jgi:hypothetical protein
MGKGPDACSRSATDLQVEPDPLWRHYRRCGEELATLGALSLCGGFSGSHSRLLEPAEDRLPTPLTCLRIES